MPFRSRIFLLTALLTLACLASVAFAQKFAVHGIRFVQKDDSVTLGIQLSAKSEFRSFVLDDPYRIIVDLPRFSWETRNIEKSNDFVVTDIRQGPLQEDISRIVFDLKAPVQIKNTTFNKDNVLLLDFETTTPEIFRAHKTDVFGTLGADAAVPSDMQNIISGLNPQEAFLKPASVQTTPALAPKPPVMPEKKKEPEPKKTPSYKPLIVIDPGHGGIDPGAIGSDGQKEKAVVLALAKDLKDLLLESGRYRVEMTRDKDIFLSLKDRVKFARSQEADLFISIHADSIHRPEVHGSSVYTLSKEASDAQTAKLAEKENQADLIGGIDLSVEDEQVAFILGDFLMTETLNQSKFFANTLVASMKDSGVYVLDNTHRYAGFAVLKAPDVPSILVEAGFMSNKKEAQMLSNEKHRAKISKALVKGIDAYFSHMDPEAIRR